MNKITMTQEEKFEEAKRLYETANADQKYVLESLFPELKESDDERIKRCISDAVRKYGVEFATGTITKEKMLAWLEKQGEIIKEWSETKFNNINKELQEMVDLKHKTEQGEQKPVIEMKSAEESLGIDSDTYNKIVDECIYELEEQNPSDVSKQEPIDTTDLTDFEKCFKGMCCDKNQKFVKECCVLLLELARKQIQGEPKQEWSEEDERNCEWLMTVCDRIHYKSDPQVAPDCALMLKDWLKSLKDKYTWKPSELQLECLSDAIEHYHTLNYPATKLVELLEQLKKL